MKGWVVRGVGSPKEVYEWDDVPEPSHEAMRELTVDFAGLRERREGEPPFESYLFIDVLASALAIPDITMASNEYPIPEPVPRPYVSGQEAVGIAYDASPDLAHLIGKRVMGFTTQPYGSFAPKAVVMPPNLYEVPDDMSDEEAAGFSMAALTAYFAVHHRGKVQSGETVLILGAAGGVPSAAVQLCKAAGCRVIAHVGGKQKAEFVRELGADLVIDHTQEDFVEAVVRETGPSSVDAIVDFLQGEPGKRARPLLRTGGRHIIAGHAAGVIPIQPEEFYIYNYDLIGCCVGYGYDAEEAALIQKNGYELVQRLYANKQYRGTISKVISLDQIPEALGLLKQRSSFGRIVVKM